MHFKLEGTRLRILNSGTFNNPTSLPFKAPTAPTATASIATASESKSIPSHMEHEGTTLTTTVSTALAHVYSYI